MNSWRFTCRLENVRAADSVWVELRDEKGNRLYRVGMTGGRNRIERWVSGNWARLWMGDVAGAAPQAEGIGVFCFNGYLFIEVGEPGDVRFVTAPLGAAVDAGTGAASREGGPAGGAAIREIDWTVRPESANGALPRVANVIFEDGARPAVIKPTVGAAMQKEAIMCYLPWFPADYTAPGYQRQTDFPVVPLSLDPGYDVLAEQFRMMADCGVTAVSADMIFFTTDRARAGIASFKRFLDTLRGAGPAGFKAVPFIELKDIPLGTAAALYLLERLGDDPNWLRAGGRPVFLTYHNAVHLQMTPEKWTLLVEGVRAEGHDAFWIYDFDGIETALTGRVDPVEADRFVPVSDGVFHFGGASLTASAEFTRLMRERVAGRFPQLAVGASIHPGYCSARTYSRNFISPRHTAELRETWALAEAGKPDFIHLTTWNDWNEATSFCPSYGDAGSRLEILRRYLGDFLGKALPEGRPGVPELVLSYRKSLYPGEPLKLEILPLPTRSSSAMREVKCEVVVTELATGRELLRKISPALAMGAEAAKGAMRPWSTGVETEAWGGSALTAPGVLGVTARAWVDGREIRYHHLPDIVVAEPQGYNDQLFYSVPLHRLAGAERVVTLSVNGSAGERGPATGSGLYGVRYEVSGPGADGALVAGMKRGHLMRFLAPLASEGAEVADLNQEVRLTPAGGTGASGGGHVAREVSESAGCWTLSERGADYFAALARFKDGTWAWSRTVIATPPAPPATVLADWVFAGPKPELMGNVAGADKAGGVIEDRSIYRQNLSLPEKMGSRFITPAGGGRVLQFDGNTVLKAEPDTAANGPVSVEVVFSPGQIGREEAICWQRGAQAGLVIDEAGFLKAMRLPELRRYPDPFVEVRSLHALKAGRFYHAVAVFTGSALQLYLDGKLQAGKPCVGTRSTEGFSIGGNSGGRVAATVVDGMPSEGFFTGRLARVSVYGGGLPAPAIEALSHAAHLLPFGEEDKQ